MAYFVWSRHRVSSAIPPADPVPDELYFLKSFRGWQVLYQQEETTDLLHLREEPTDLLHLQEETAVLHLQKRPPTEVNGLFCKKVMLLYRFSSLHPLCQACAREDTPGSGQSFTAAMGPGLRPRGHTAALQCLRRSFRITRSAARPAAARPVSRNPSR